jgi:ketosteroid isomerase-like protein
MKIRLLLALTGLAVGFAVPAFAQEKDTPDAQLRQQFEANDKKLDEAWNNNDAAAVAALFTEKAVLVTPKGPIYGREGIEKYYLDLFQKEHFSAHVTKSDQNSPHSIGTTGNEAWEIGEFSLTYQVEGGVPIQVKGYWSNISVRDGDSWRKQMVTYNITPAPTN